MNKKEDMDPAHAFYLGFELAKAKMALTLGKNYRQDNALHWGLLTIEESPRYEGTSEKHAPSDTPSSSKR
jgi:hypothetical protein